MDYNFITQISANFTGSLLSGLIAIWIFIEGSKKAKRREAEKLTELRKLDLNHFINLCNYELEIIEKNVNSYNEYINYINSDPLGEYYLKNYASSNLERLNRFDSNTIHLALDEIYTTKKLHSNNNILKPLNIHQQIYKCIDFLMIEKELTKTLLFEMQSNIISVKSQISDKLQELKFTIGRITYTLEQNELNKDLIKMMLETTTVFYQNLSNESNTLLNHQNSLIIPLRDNIIKGDFTNTNEKLVLLEIINTINTKINHVKKLSNELAYQIQNIKFDMDSQRDKLSESVKQIEMYYIA